MDWGILIDITGASAICSVSPEYLRRLCRLGDLSAHKFGGRWVVTLESVRKYLVRKGVSFDEIREKAQRVLNDSEADSLRCAPSREVD